MPGGHGSRGGGRPLDQQSAFDLWLIALYIPMFPAVPLVASFFVTPATPWWAQWLGRSAFVVVLAAAWWFVSRPRLRELRRRKRVSKPIDASDTPGAAGP